MLENIKIFFNPVYFFYPYPGYQFEFQTLFLVVFGLCLVLGIAFALMARKVKKKNPHFATYILGANWGFWGGLTGLMLIFARNQGIPYFSMRALLFFWIIAMMLWGVWVIKSGRVAYERALKTMSDKQARERWTRK